MPRAENFRIDIQERRIKFNQSAYDVKMYSFTFEKPFFFWCYLCHIN